MQPKIQKVLSGWGNFAPKLCTVFRPERMPDICEIFREHNGSIVARGMGKSYGDAALNREGVISTNRLARFLDFDERRGVIRAQSGVILAEILDITVPKGWFLPVIPGTKFVSLGGAVAANVHGKNHYKLGEFASHVTDMKLRLTNGETIHCSPDSNPDIFWATAGGMGMTGFIEEVAVKLIPIKSTALHIETVRVPNLDKMIEHMRRGLGDSDYLIGWIDHFGKGEYLGRGIFEKASHVKKSDNSLKYYRSRKTTLTIPFFFPSFVLNKYVMALYNNVRFAGVSDLPKKEKTSFESFFHPLDSINNWNRLYGKGGFLQYQCLVPDGTEAKEQLRHILQMIQEQKLFSYLAVLKYHGPSEGMMTFSEEGYSLALDFPNTPDVHNLLDEIDAYLCDIGGRVYLAKDARLKPASFEIMYKKGLNEWRKLLKQMDPKRKIRSSMARRLGFRGGK